MPPSAAAIRVCYVGNGIKHTRYSFQKATHLHEFGPSRRSPSWQCDLPTKKGVEDTTTIMLDSFIPFLQGGPVETDVKLNPTEVKKMGFMLSLKLSSGKSHLVETYGSGIFPFSLKILSSEPVGEDELS